MVKSKAEPTRRTERLSAQAHKKGGRIAVPHNLTRDTTRHPKYLDCFGLEVELIFAGSAEGGGHTTNSRPRVPIVNHDNVVVRQLSHEVLVVEFGRPGVQVVQDLKSVEGNV